MSAVRIAPGNGLDVGRVSSALYQVAPLFGAAGVSAGSTPARGSSAASDPPPPPRGASFGSCEGPLRRLPLVPLLYRIRYFVGSPGLLRLARYAGG
jgi:hypothetical protein